MTRGPLFLSLGQMKLRPNDTQHQDEFWMGKALKLAEQAARLDEVPVGALLVAADGQTILGKAFNRRESWKTPLGHAELTTLHRASQKEQSWRLVGSTLYVTLEPCLMCAGALIQARVQRVVFGASDPKAGAVKSLFQVLEDPRLNHRCQVTVGVLGVECGQILTDYFRAKRKAQKRLT